jgi:FimV-like protein
MQQRTVPIASVVFVIDAPYVYAPHYVAALVNHLNGEFRAAGLNVYCTVESTEDHCIKVKLAILGAVITGTAAFGAWTVEQVKDYQKIEEGVTRICQRVQKLEHRIPSLKPVLAYCHDLMFLAYGPVAEGETLTAIAKKLGLHGYTEAQLMLAIVEENPHAFVDGNVDRLRAGATLNIPTPERVIQTSPSKALKELTRRRSAAP